MSKVIECDAIFPGCAGKVRADEDEEVLRLAAEHARQVHGLQELDDQTVSKFRAAIKAESH